MAEGVNQSFSEMSLHLHRTVAVQEAHMVLMRLRFPSTDPALQIDDKGKASVQLHVNFMFPI